MASKHWETTTSLSWDLTELSLSFSGSYVDSTKWIKNKKITISPENDEDDKCFQHTVIVALDVKTSKNVYKEQQRFDHS